MPILELRVSATLDGNAVSGFPLSRTLTVTEAQSFNVQLGTAAGAVVLPDNQIQSLQALLVTADQPTSLSLNASAGGTITLAAGGLLLLLDATFAGDQSLTNNRVTNTGAVDASLRGFAAGA